MKYCRFVISHLFTTNKMFERTIDLDTHLLPSIWLHLFCYLNIFYFPLWCLVNMLFLYYKFDSLGSLTKFLSLAILLMTVVIEALRLYFGYVGSLFKKVPDMAGFLMMTILMQLPLISYFLFNPYLHNTPTEITMHITLWIMLICELITGYFALKGAADNAKLIYLSKPRCIKVKRNS